MNEKEEAIQIAEEIIKNIEHSHYNSSNTKKFYRLVNQLGMKNEVEWILQEIYGYQDKKKFPAYRKFRNEQKEYAHVGSSYERLLTFSSTGRNYNYPITRKNPYSLSNVVSLSPMQLKQILVTVDNEIHRKTSNILTKLKSNKINLDIQENSKFIDITNYPDNFYKKLIEEINFQYATNHPVSLSILIRKLFENLIIDIFRKKYGKGGIDLFYIKPKGNGLGRFKDFSELLDNFESKISDFHYLSTSIDTNFIQGLIDYKEKGNSAVHSIDANITHEYFTEKKDDINHKVDLLIRLYNNIQQKDKIKQELDKLEDNKT